jgi:hypothetical protein
MSTPGIYSFSCKSTENIKKSFWSSDLMRKGKKKFSGQALCKGQNFFSQHRVYGYQKTLMYMYRFRTDLA